MFARTSAFGLVKKRRAPKIRRQKALIEPLPAQHFKTSQGKPSINWRHLICRTTRARLHPAKTPGRPVKTSCLSSLIYRESPALPDINHRVAHRQKMAKALDLPLD
jgi:hypothetical protein